MITGIVHTYNEQENIERCLSSLSFVDEIVVVDMGSTDKTKEIVKQFKTKIFDHPYTGFVEPARNFAIAKATHRWILILDADEEVPRSLAWAIKEIISSKKGAKDYYRIARKNIIYGKWVKYSGWWPDYQIRLFKKGSVSWVDKLHGIPITKGYGADFDSRDDLALIHHHYYSIEQFIERMNRYSSIAAKDLFFKNISFSPKQLIVMPVNEFVKRFFLMEGYKDGIHGLALSSLQSISELVVYLKLWELNSFSKGHVSLRDFEQYVKLESRIKQYWLANEMLKKPSSLIHKIILKIKRSFASYG